MTLNSPSIPNSIQIQRPKLLAPAGDWECVKAAVENGADAIYFGLDRFNARMRAQNFTEADLPDLMAFLHRRGVQGYVTLNTLIFPQELLEAEQYLRTMITAGVDAVIVQDVGICRLIRQLSPDFPIHASTQMTISSAAGVAFAQDLGCQLVVLARECSIREIDKIQQQLRDRHSLPLEVFVHGALCVAYSGQCLTSEALGGRSANRGECAQACRMPYDLIVDGQEWSLEEETPLGLRQRRYLLSPQDLAGLEVLPDLVKTGITCLKIEGRLKAPEYVANITRVYRQALDRVMDQLEQQSSQFVVEKGDRYSLEMSFSRGLYTGWFNGIDNQALVHAEFGKKRGVYLGEVTQIRGDRITLQLQAPLSPGDGVVFDNGHPETKEEGGRVYTVEQKGSDTVLTFGRDALNFRRIRVGDRLWKTSDPQLDRQIRQTYTADHPQFQRPLTLEVYGAIDQPLIVIARDEQGHIAQVESTMPLVAAHQRPLTGDRLREQLGRLGQTPFYLQDLTLDLTDPVMLPVSELNRLRRQLVENLEEQRSRPRQWQLVEREKGKGEREKGLGEVAVAVSLSPQLLVLVRNLQQLEGALGAIAHTTNSSPALVQTLYCEFEDPRKYRDAVKRVRDFQETYPDSPIEILVAPPRITKPGENWILEQVRSSQADGYLVRNFDHLQFFAGERCVGDFSLNVANALTADYFKNQFQLERLTASYDLNAQQLADLLQSCPPHWFEITIHQHMPMFHMEHCVFCAFLSTGKDYTDCGRPCETHQVKLRDRTGTEHPLQADAGCRNTLFNGTAQTGAEYVQRFLEFGATHFRIEFVNESPERVGQTIDRYQQLLQGKISGSQLWKDLKLQNQLGVTRGTGKG
ncbi:MAG: DUF3656 domain-containing protein [Oculatellaceae cyanobacterium Prado106]|nr:DUF3656 domain-containing protein [Oculatellaceae cyanobacterium Prado106]